MTTDYATYCPEDNKLRLYVGRVPRDEYEKLRADGWTSTTKQDCDFAAVWTPSRYATALAYSDGAVLDEDQSPEDRAADRAERFGGYRDKRLGEAVGHADRYDAGPSAFGFQNQARAERAAARHDRIADRATDAWEKAEYWQQRTAGVIAHALYSSRPDVRMGRIKTLEAEQRKQQASIAEYVRKWELWQKVAFTTEPEKQTELAKAVAGSVVFWGDYTHPRTGKKNSLYSLLYDQENPITGAEAASLYMKGNVSPESDAWQSSSWMQWSRHYELRLTYERQMLEAQGGRAAMVEMEVGGWIGKHQIRKVNKSPATGRVVSVTLKMSGDRWGRTNEGFHLRPFNVERLPQGVYRAPSPEDLAALEAEKKQEKAEAPKKDPCPLVNPTDDDAERLQAILNERAMRAYGRDYAEEYKPSTICRITQATYSEVSKRTYAKAETRTLHGNGELADRETNMYSRAAEERKTRIGKPVCKIRITSGNGSDYGAKRVIILTDKPQKPLPVEVWQPLPDLVNA